MAELSLGKILLSVFLLSFFVFVMFDYTGKIDYMEKYDVLFPDKNPFRYTYVFGDVLNVQLGQKVYYDKGYVQIDAVYCGYGVENEYAILQSDAVSNPQKIPLGSNVSISGHIFKLNEDECKEVDRYVILTRLE